MQIYKTKRTAHQIAQRLGDSRDIAGIGVEADLIAGGENLNTGI
jgi:hypothetical protein